MTARNHRDAPECFISVDIETAGPVPSKTAADQSITSREADLALVQSFAQREDVAGDVEVGWGANWGAAH